MVQKLCRPQIYSLSGRPLYGLLKEVDGPGNLSVVTTRNACLSVRSDTRRHAAEMYAVTGRDTQVAGQSQFASPTTTWLEARSVMRNRKLKIKSFEACKRKVVTPTPRN